MPTITLTPEPTLTVTPEQLSELKSLPAVDRLRWMIYVERRLKLLHAARQMGLSHQALLNWFKFTGAKPLRPGTTSRCIIEKWSSTSILGPIAPEDWSTDNDRESLKRVHAPPAWTVSET